MKGDNQGCLCVHTVQEDIICSILPLVPAYTCIILGKCYHQVGWAFARGISCTDHVLTRGDWACALGHCHARSRTNKYIYTTSGFLCIWGSLRLALNYRYECMELGDWSDVSHGKKPSYLITMVASNYHHEHAQRVNEVTGYTCSLSVVVVIIRLFLSLTTKSRPLNWVIKTVKSLEKACLKTLDNYGKWPI